MSPGNRGKSQPRDTESDGEGSSKRSDKKDRPKKKAKKSKISLVLEQLTLRKKESHNGSLGE